MNLATAEKIKYIADSAHSDCALTTLKNAKAQIEQRSKVFAGFESQWVGVNRLELLAAFKPLLAYSRKADFSAHCELLSEAMEKQIAAERFNERVAHTIKIANRDHGVWVTAEQVIAAAAGNHLFNFTKVARMLAEQARESAECNSQVADKNSDSREWSDCSIEHDHAEALALNELPMFSNECIAVFNLEVGMRVAVEYAFHTIEAIKPCPHSETKYRLFLRRNNGSEWTLDVSCMTKLQVSGYRSAN